MSGKSEKELPFSVTPKDVRNVAIASSIGTFIDFYVFILAGTASGTIWPALYFQQVSKIPGVAVALSFLSFGAAYVVRPVGGIIFGHFGDKMGRMSTLVSTLIVIFIGTIGMALVPPYSVLGILAPALLILFRIIQGLGFGGEWGGASTWLIEYVAKPEKRGFWSGILGASAWVGIGSAAVSFGVLYLLFPTQFIMNLGWRILFGIGAIAAIVGGIIRARLRESPIFINYISKRRPAKLPSLEIFKAYGGRILHAAAAYFLGVSVTGVVITPFTLQYLIASGKHILLGIPTPAFVLLMLGIGAYFTIISAALGGWASDKLGRRMIIVISSIGVGALTYPYFLLIGTLNPYAIMAALILIQVFQGLSVGSIGAYFVELFPTKYRYSGSGLSFQFAGFYLGVTTAFLIPPLIAGIPITHAVNIIAGVQIAIALVSLISVLFLKETKGIQLED
ncbi:MFS transporter [Sulfolobus tengchongensis]|uniref:MFS transporter n=1 Tax=Sulfolobus tengchongensis TaxID=207809 RepID=A0AAX4L3J0_9CREN